MKLLSGLLRFRSRPPQLVCQEAVELVTDYLEDALSPADRRRFEAHLAVCPTALSTWRRSARRSGWPAGSSRKT